MASWHSGRRGVEATTKQARGWPPFVAVIIKRTQSRVGMYFAFLSLSVIDDLPSPRRKPAEFSSANE